MTRNSNLTYIESDLKELTSEKIRLISQLRVQYPLENDGNHHIAIANALDLDQLRAAVRPLRRDQRLAIVNEGLIQYFSVAEREVLAKNVHNLLQEFGGGVWITPDFILKTEASNTFKDRRILIQSINSAAGKNVNNAAFDTYEQMNSFFMDYGFKSTLYSQIDETPYLASVKTLNLPPQLLEQVKARYKIWVLSLV